jgi:hypothetical protein
VGVVLIAQARRSNSSIAPNLRIVLPARFASYCTSFIYRRTLRMQKDHPFKSFVDPGKRSSGRTLPCVRNVIYITPVPSLIPLNLEHM